jgi:phosphoglycerate dehydrogenase-like enzyme
MFKEEPSRPRASEATAREQQEGAGSTRQPPIGSKVSFIGLGRMGSAMAANLCAAGYSVIGHVRSVRLRDRR